MRTLLAYLRVLSNMVLLMNDQLNRMEAAINGLETLVTDLSQVVANLRANQTDPGAADRLAALNNRLEAATSALVAVKG